MVKKSKVVVSKPRPKGPRYVPAPLGRGEKSLVQMTPGHVSRVQHSVKDEVSISKIIERFHRTGELPTPKPSVYGDARFLAMTGEQKFNAVRAAERLYDQLPDEIKALAPSAAEFARLDRDFVVSKFNEYDKSLQDAKDKAAHAEAVGKAKRAKAVADEVSPPVPPAKG